MAAYFPLLAEAIGNLSASSPESRRIVYERLRKALIGRLRTLHPPASDDDIERESVELDRVISQLESELASAATPTTGTIEATSVGAHLDPSSVMSQTEGIGRVLRVATETFGTEEKAQRWLRRPTSALDGASPQAISSAGPAGVDKVLDLLNRIDHGLAV